MCRNFSIKWVENVIKLSDIEKQKNSPMLFSGARSVNECAPSLSAWWALVLLSLDLSCAPTETKTSARKRLSRQRFWILPLLSLAESKLQYWLKAAQARAAAAAAQLYFLEITRFLISDSTPVNFSKIIRDIKGWFAKIHACTCATCGRTCACKKTYKTGVQSVCARTFLS